MIWQCPVPLGSYERSIGEMLLARLDHSPKSVLCLERVANPSGTGPAGEFQSFTWEAILSDVQSVALSLLERGAVKGDRIAILSENRREMLVTLLACYSVGLVAVPIFFGYFPDQVRFVLDHSAAKFLFAADRSQWSKVERVGRPETLQEIFLYQGEVEGTTRYLDFFRLSGESTKNQSAFRNHVASIDANDTAVIMYTSGTTGLPKGVELSHQNILSQQAALSKVWPVQETDRFLSYLPWHHCFGGLFETFMALYNRVPMALDASRGKDVELLLENWRSIRPTIYFSVPMIYQLILNEMRLDPSLRSVIFHDELRCVFTAAAPLPADLYRVFAEYGIQVHEGWGLTEASPDITITRPGRKTEPGNVGEVIPGVAIRLSEEGEVLCRGPNVMKGYYRNPEATAQTLTPDGWLRTGDLGEMREDGLRIIGRVDGVFKLMNGEKVPSATIEGELVCAGGLVERAVAVGRGRDYVTAVLFANEKRLRQVAVEIGLNEALSLADLVQKEEVATRIVSEVRQANQRLDTKFYRVRKVHLAQQPASLELGELTPTGKVCRNKVIERYQDPIDAMYHGEATLHGLRSFLLV